MILSVDSDCAILQTASGSAGLNRLIAACGLPRAARRFMKPLCNREQRLPGIRSLAFDNVDMPEENDAPPTVVECQMCHQSSPSTQTVMMGGRLLCFGCASAWFEDEDGDEGPERKE